MNVLSDEAANYRPPEQSLAESELPEMKGNPLATLDIFAGCGGLSYGLEMSGVAKIKWGIEVEDSFAMAFQQNHPDSRVLAMNVNDVLSLLLNGEQVNSKIIILFIHNSFLKLKSYYNVVPIPTVKKVFYCWLYLPQELQIINSGSLYRVSQPVLRKTRSCSAKLL